MNVGSVIQFLTWATNGRRQHRSLQGCDSWTVQGLEADLVASSLLNLCSDIFYWKKILYLVDHF